MVLNICDLLGLALNLQRRQTEPNSMSELRHRLYWLLKAVSRWRPWLLPPFLQYMLYKIHSFVLALHLRHNMREGTKSKRKRCLQVNVLKGCHSLFDTRILLFNLIPSRVSVVCRLISAGCKLPQQTKGLKSHRKRPVSTSDWKQTLCIRRIMELYQEY